ncbi:general secretion pathway protein GspB [Arsukibacterium sp.]|uniref:general secretion pathway protein GspB n=1 Tax=Arsukibacterium sp. TaxID=1977258 RepID=UPI002FD8BE7C
MSILMDALKQQVPATAQPAQASPWRVTALVLALLLAVLLGFVAGYFLLKYSAVQPVADSNSVMLAEPVVASATSIASRFEPVETTALVAQATVASEATQTSTAATPGAEMPAAGTPAAATRVAEVRQPQVQVEPLPVRPPMVTVTAPSQNSATAELSDSAVSDELQQLFASALAATERSNTPSTGAVVRNHQAPAQDIRSLDSQLQQQIPSLRFEAHVYATSPAQRWVKVNGKTLQEGQWITADIRLREITPQYVLLEFGQQLFSMAALSDWR